MQHLKLKSARLLAAVTLLAIGTQNALAQSTSYLDPGLAGHYSQLTSDVGTVSSKAWPVAFLVAGIFFGLGLFKKFTRKSG